MSKNEEGVKIYILKQKMTDEEIKSREGTYFDEKEIQHIIDHDADIYGLNSDGTKQLLAKFRKGVFPREVTDNAWKAFHKTAGPSRNRGAAAGPIDTTSAYWKKRDIVSIHKWAARYKQDGKVSKMDVNNNVYSSVLGYFEDTPFMKLPCRMTSYTQMYFKYFQQGVPFLQAIAKQFQELVPERYKIQIERARAQPSYQIEDTPFSSCTVNRNFRTALHRDAGDLREGFGNLSVVEMGKYHGGYTCFPQYDVGFDLRTGDFIAMNVHEWHCNTAMYETEEDKEFNKTLPKFYRNNENTGTLGSSFPFTRISFVCYWREKLANCKFNETRKYYDKIQFSPKRGSLKPSRKTQRKSATNKAKE